ncbi:MAG: putative DNA binding domain-containing protein [Gemmataceae bacterium]|nr:putative DNA binding domain-containing protein [Gemmataceae bacterium]
MEYAQLLALVEQGESETLEFKKTTGERKDAAQSLCAMLNHRGGHVLFGVEPNGRILGQQVADRTLEEVAVEIQQIEPAVFPRVVRVDVRPDLQVIAVEVSVGPNRPYTYKNQAYKRVGNTSPKMTRDEYNRVLLERFHGERRWETEPATGWSSADLDASEITRTVDEAIRRGRLEEPGTREPHALLRGLGLLRDEQILRAAVALFGKPQRVEAELPQLLLRVAKFKGTDKTEFLDNRQFNGHAFDLMRRAEQFLRENLPIAGRIVPGLFERIDEPLYPPVALREALANAFCHRDYSIGGGSVAVAVYQDRLEITSTGSLHFGLTPEKLFLPHESQPWNPLIARVFHRRGFIESWGRGTLKMAELTEQAGLPSPEIEEGPNFVLVRFRPSSYIPPRQVKQDLTARQQRILQLLSQRPGIGRKAIQGALELGVNELKSDLQRLRALGLIRQSGRGRGTVLFLVEGSQDAEPNRQ